MLRPILPLLVVVAAVSACSSGGSELRIDAGGGRSGVINTATPVGHSTILRVRDICTTGGPVTITSVTAVDPTGGLHVTSWGLRTVKPSSTFPPDDDLGAGPGTVRELSSFSHEPVTVRCSESQKPDATVVQQMDLSVAGTADGASMTGYEVHSDSGTATGQFAARVCAGHTCAALPGFRH